MMNNYQDIAAQRQVECDERATYFDSQLRIFSKTNWITVLVPSLLGGSQGRGYSLTPLCIYWVLVRPLG